jgi:SSS family solute:Na+ symporter
MGVLDIIIFFAFILAVVGIGMWKSKGEDTEGKDGAAEYFLAGRG